MNPDDPSPPPPVAIIGMACLFPKADDLAAYWANIRNRIDAITEVPSSHWRTEDYFDADPKSPDRTYARRGGFLSPVDFPPLDFGIAPNNLEATDTTQLLGLLVARRALEDAGYGDPGGKPFDRDRVSVVLGVTGTLELVIPLGARLGHPIWRRALKDAGVPGGQAEEVVRRIADSYVGWQENSFPGLLGNVAAGRIANRLDLHGTNCVTDAACASSVAAVNLALLELAAGRCDVALSGGIDTFNDIFMYMCFSKTPALSPRGDARPFDAGCDGTILGEGLGLLVLKRLADARRDGDRVYAVIRSVGTSSDGKGNAVYAPSAPGQARALRRAYESAGIPPATVELVEAHGTGTKVGDATELSALREVYAESRPEGTWCALGSVKSQIGHTKAAAGAAGLIKAALALHHKVLPPTIKVETPVEGVGPGRSPFYVNTEPRPWLPRPDHPRRAAVSAFGFGGSNYHCVLEEAGPAKPGIDWDGSVQILAFSSKTREGLTGLVDAWPRGLGWSGVRVEAARLRERFRPEDAHRLTLVVDQSSDVEAALAGARSALAASAGSKAATIASPRPRDGVFIGSGGAPGGLGMLFPGQGSQYVGMLRELACLFPQLQEALAAADALDDDPARGPRLSDRIYPVSAFDESERSANEAALRATESAQPAIGAISLGLFRILEHFGIRADAVGGHSYGELTALCAAGWLGAEAFARVSRERGRLMGAEAARGGGSMLAVLAPLGVVEEVLGAEGLERQLVIANKNAPRQFVLSGPTAAVEQASKAFERKGVTTRSLPVSAAFHSPAVSGASGPFRETLRAIDLTPTGTPVYANTTARPYPETPDEARGLLASQLARPVEFAGLIEAMADSGIGVFVEVGPDAKLSGLVRSILDGPGKPARVVALDASRGTRGNLVDLATALAELAALGYRMNLSRWDDGVDARVAPARKPGLTVKLTGANLTPKPPARTEHPTPPPTPPASKPVPTPTPTPPATKPATRSSIPTPVASPTMTPTPPPERPAPPPEAPPTRIGPDRQDRSSAAPRPASANGQGPPPVETTPAHASLLAEALRTSQENLLALQRLGEQTADLHRQFLEGQDLARRTFQAVLEQQHRLALSATGSLAAGPATLPLPPAPPIPEPTLAVEPRPAAAKVASIVTPEPAVEPVRVQPPDPAPISEPSRSTSGTSRALPVLLDVVSEKTGYPVEMLEPTMRLDADLGIDSIKRVEILSTLQERLPDAPAVKPEHLGTLLTLQDIADFLADGEPGTVGVVDSSPSGAVSAPPEPDTAEALSVLLEVVAEKTGYPVEMLEPTMQLDADLGIDSIKRVEILSALQERLPDAPAVKPEHLGTLLTLQDIADFLAPARPSPSVAVAGGASAGPILQVLLTVVAEKTGYPVEMLEPSMQLDADLGIDSIKRVEILSALQERLPDAPAVKPEHLGTLLTLQDIADFLGSAPAVVPAPSAPERESRPEPDRLATTEPGASGVLRLVVREVAAQDGGPDRAVRPGATFWILDDGAGLSAAVAERLAERGHRSVLVKRGEVSALSEPDRLDGLVLISGRSGARGHSLEDAFRVLRLAGPGLRRSGAETGARLLSVSRLDGAFGLRGLPVDADPASGGLAGLTKTAAREWPEVRCTAIDLAPDLGSAAELAEAVVDEIFRRGPVEVGLSRAGRSTIAIAPEPLSRSGRGARLEPCDEGEVIVVTGGARGVTAEVALALAKAFRPTLVLLGRTPAPDAEPEWLAGLRSESEIKRALAAKANGQATPQRIGEQYRNVAAHREVRANLARIEAAGARVVYRQVDVRDPRAIRAAVEAVRAEFGPVRGLIHGAGVLADRKIEDQTDEQFSLVFDTKVVGLNALLDLLPPDELKLLVVFSSTTARFGRSGQVAYAAANEVLNKTAQREARRRPDCRVVSMNWGPWEGGMVSPALRAVFEAEGVGLIPLESGARALVDELRFGSPGAVEVALLGGETIPASLQADLAPAAPAAPAPRERTETPTLTKVFDRPLDLDALPILRDHVIDGRGVLPMALTLEWLALGALQRNPGLTLRGLDDFRLLKGAVLHDGRDETLTVLVGKAVRDAGAFRVPVELRGQEAGGPTVVHARAEVLLGDRPAEPGRVVVLPEQPVYLRPIRSVYHDMLFHGPVLQGIERIDALGPRGADLTVRTGPKPTDWMARPPRQSWLTDPLAIDCAFQLMCLWCHEQLGATSLPTRVGVYRQFRRAFPASRVRILVRVERPAEHRALAEFLFLDADGAPVAQVEGYECVIDASLNQAFRRNRLAGPRPVSTSTPR